MAARQHMSHRLGLMGVGTRNAARGQRRSQPCVDPVRKVSELSRFGRQAAPGRHELTINRNEG